MKFIMPRFIFNVERWKWNDEFRVYVSTLGHFKDEYKRPLPVKINQNGYCYIKTFNGNYKSAHRLVLLTWCKVPNAEALTVDHLDHNKRNNALDNLEWVTRKENEYRAIEDSITTAQNEIPFIYCVNANRKFNSPKAAANWLISTDSAMKKNKDNIHPKRVENKIIKALESGKTYCDREWRFTYG